MRKITLFLISIFATVSLMAQWTNIQLASPPSPKNDIVSIQFDSKGTMWIASNYGILKKEAGVWQIQGVENIYPESFFIDSKDCKWAGIWGGGVYKCTDDINWTKSEEASISLSANVISEDRKGVLRIGTWNKGVAILKENEWTYWKSSDTKVGDNSILSICDDKSGRVWVGSHHGLSVFNGEKWEQMNTQNSQLPANVVYTLNVDSKDNLWVGTYNGLAQLSKGKWRIFNTENSGLRSNVILSLAIDKKGNIWVGTPKGLAMYNGSKWKTYTVENSNLLENRIQTICIYGEKIHLGTSLGLAEADINLLTKQ